jgi:acetyltransferase-like isoleucine patch superfamily enzyme
MSTDIFDKLKNNQAVPFSDSEYYKIPVACRETKKLLLEMNSKFDQAEIRGLLTKITSSEIDNSVTVFTPLHINYGKNIKFGKNVFVNFDCTFLDLGGIAIEDDVMLAPGVKLLSESHPIVPVGRQTLTTGAIHIKKNAWIGANAVIMAGVTIGENAIVAAGAVVSKDVPANSIAAGVPAKIIKSIKNEND